MAWFEEPRRHSKAARKGWSSRKRKAQVKKALHLGEKKLIRMGEYVTRNALAAIAIDILVLQYGMNPLVAKKYVILALS